MRIHPAGDPVAGRGSYVRLDPSHQRGRGGGQWGGHGRGEVLTLIQRSARRRELELRRGELDALRALVVVGLVFFHTAVIFGAGEFPVKAEAENRVVTVLIAFGATWGMPLLFLISGMGARYSLRSRDAGAFARERLRRLGPRQLRPVPALRLPGRRRPAARRGIGAPLAARRGPGAAAVRGRRGRRLRGPGRPGRPLHRRVPGGDVGPLRPRRPPPPGDPLPVRPQASSLTPAAWCSRPPCPPGPGCRRRG